MKKIAIVIGHNAKSGGAVLAVEPTTNECAYWSIWGKALAEYSDDNVQFEIFNRLPSISYKDEIKEVYGRVDAWGADLSIELHFNAANTAAKGAETLSSGSDGSMKLATIIQNRTAELLGLSEKENRGIKVVSKEQRGGPSVHYGQAPAVLLEPFFGSNPEDYKRFHALRLPYLKMLHTCVYEYFDIKAPIQQKACDDEKVARLLTDAIQTLEELRECIKH
jgi:N-acetylmuramoyl-L-alanine amidase